MLVTVFSNAQTDLRRNHIRITGIGAFQIPSVLKARDLTARYTGQHFFLGLAYHRAISPTWQVGGGVGISYAVLKVALNGQYSDNTGTYTVSEEQSAPIIWYPFERGLTGTYAVHSDPFHVWAEVIRTFKINARGSRWEVSGIFGGLSSLGWSVGLGANAAPVQLYDRTPAYAYSDYGDSWHLLTGLGLDRIIAIKKSNGVVIGLDWRFSLSNYFEQGVGQETEQGDFEIKARGHRYMWIGMRIGYDISWGGKN